MTAEQKQGVHAANVARASTLPFDPADLVAMRVLPAQFARMCRVSKTTVSKWIKRGIVTLGPDGKLDPAIASRQVVEGTNPIKLRARVFKDAVAGRDELRARIAELERELAIEREWGDVREKAAGARASDAASQALGCVMDALSARFDEACAARAAHRLERWLDELAAVLFYGEDLDEYRREFPEDDNGDGAA